MLFLLISRESQPTVFSVKTAPEWSEELREQYHQIKGAYHTNKTHWNSVVCDDFSSLTKKKQQEIQ